MMIARQESWKDIPGYEGLYEASDFGRIRNMRTGLVLQAYKRKRSGCVYLSVTLYRDGKKKEVDVHRLVALTFLGPCPKGYETCHGVGRNLCNELWNLCYGTHKKNSADMKRDGTQYDGGEQRRKVRRSDGQEYASLRDAARSIGTGRNQYQNILSVCKGRRKIAYGYGWSYIQGTHSTNDPGTVQENDTMVA